MCIIFFINIDNPSADRRVHITAATLAQLDGRFQVEPGGGQQRDQLLADLKVETYLIVPLDVS